MAQLTLQVQTGQTESRLMQLGRALPRAATVLLNAAAELAVAELRKAVLSQVRMPISKLDSQIDREPASDSSPVATVTVGNRRVSLKYFGAVQTTAGVSYRISTGGGRKTAISAFGPKIGALGNHVFVRETYERFPIRKLWGPSPAGVLIRDGEVGERVMNRVGKFMTDGTAQHVSDLVAGHGGPV